MGNKNSELNLLANELYNRVDRKMIDDVAVIERAGTKLFSTFESVLNQKYYEVGLMENTLTKINPLNILEKGYAKVEQNGAGISSSNQIDKNEEIRIIFKDGSINAKPL